jgi:TusA-related sulfurtransferase
MQPTDTTQRAIARSLHLDGLPASVVVAWVGVAMLSVRPGELVEVRSTDPDTARELRVWCRATGNRLVEESGQGGTYRFVVRRGRA